MSSSIHSGKTILFDYDISVFLNDIQFLGTGLKKNIFPLMGNFGATAHPRQGSNAFFLDVEGWSFQSMGSNLLASFT